MLTATLCAFSRSECHRAGRFCGGVAEQVDTIKHATVSSVPAPFGHTVPLIVMVPRSESFASNSFWETDRRGGPDDAQPTDSALLSKAGSPSVCPFYRTSSAGNCVRLFTEPENRSGSGRGQPRATATPVVQTHRTGRKHVRCRCSQCRHAQQRAIGRKGMTAQSTALVRDMRAVDRV